MGLFQLLTCLTLTSYANESHDMTSMECTLNLNLGGIKHSTSRNLTHCGKEIVFSFYLKFSSKTCSYLKHYYINTSYCKWKSIKYRQNVLYFCLFWGFFLSLLQCSSALWATEVENMPNTVGTGNWPIKSHKTQMLLPIKCFEF